MNPQPHEEELFHRALTVPPAERAAFLARECAGNDALRAAVVSLLRVYSHAQSFLESPAPELGATRSRLPVAESPGDTVGRYKLLQKLGEGGCGAVYMAEQEEPVRRRVALKVIKLGMDTKEVIARFEAERQALALMDHPNIAKVLDAGATEAGRPYFVMELVRGVTLTKFCDEQNLSTTARLALFTDVCHAVQHAHQKGIIHRDLKPSNILVTLHDGKPVPKVIDFGIAKATAGRLTDNTLFTAFEQFIGTPAYMSPEQAEMSGLDIDTRSDIYSLGVLLYELLTGRPPFDPKSLVSAGLDEIRRIIREVDPPRMSTRLSTLTDLDRATIARQRGIAPTQLSTLLRGDLDWIVMRCLEKDRTRRYETANSLALDVLRHLHDEPVTARPPSAAYRFQKFVRRNKLAFASAAAIALAIVGGAGVAVWQAVRATNAEKVAERARDVAMAAQKEEVKAREAAELRRKEVDEINRLLLSESLKSAAWEFTASPYDSGMRDVKPVGPDTTLRQVLDNAASRISSTFGNNPQLEAAIRHTIGDSYRKLTLYDKAQPHAEAAWEIRKRTLGGEHPDTLVSQRLVAIVQREQRKYDEAESMLRRVHAVQERVLGVDDADTLDTLSEVLRVKFMWLQTARPWTEQAPVIAEAEPLARSTYEKAKRRFGRDDPRTLKHLQDLHFAVSFFGRRPMEGKMASAHEAAALGAELLAVRRRVLGNSHPDTLDALLGYIWSLGPIGYNAEAQKLRVESLPLLEKVLGPDHEQTAISVRHLAMQHQQAGRIPEACAEFRHFATSAVKIWGWDSVSTRGWLVEFGTVLVGNGQAREAEAFALERLPEARRQAGPESPGLNGLKYVLGLACLSQGRAAEAEPLLRECIEFAKRQTPARRGPESQLGEALLLQKRYAEAEPLLLSGFDESLTNCREGRWFWLFDQTLWDAHARIVRLYSEWNRLDEAEKWKKRETEIQKLGIRRTFRPTPPSSLTLARNPPIDFSFGPSLTNGRLVNWQRFGQNIERYQVEGAAADSAGQSTLRLSSLTAQRDDYAGVWQSFNADKFRGRRVRFGFQLKADGIADFGTGYMNLTRDDGATIARTERHALGTADWTPYTIVFDVPKTGAVITVHFRLIGRGTMWIREARLDEVGQEVAPDNVLEHISAGGPPAAPTPISEATLQQKAPVNLTMAEVPQEQSPERTAIQVPAGWAGSGSKRTSYRVGLDRTQDRTQPLSLHLASIESEIIGFGGVMQKFSAENFLGRRVRFSAWIKTRDVPQRAWLFLRVDEKSGRTIRLDNMAEKAPKGTSDWARYSIVLDVPTEGAAIALGLMLTGTGEAWFNDAQFEVVGPEVPVTNS